MSAIPLVVLSAILILIGYITYGRFIARKFDLDPHLNITMPDIISQEIFDWIITLSQQPIFEKEKLQLAKKFISGLVPDSCPSVKPEAR